MSKPPRAGIRAAFHYQQNQIAVFYNMATIPRIGESVYLNGATYSIKAVLWLLARSVASEDTAHIELISAI